MLFHIFRKNFWLLDGSCTNLFIDYNYIMPKSITPNISELASALLALGALLGNAQIFGMDIFLIFIAPLLFYLKISTTSKLTLNKKRLPILIFYLGIMSVILGTSFFIKIPYNELYFLWPIKAIFMGIFLIHGRSFVWHRFFTIILITLCVFFALISFESDGRMYSIFGPNMLYRFFGLLFFLSCFKIKISQNNRSFFFWTGIFCFSFILLVQTGSSAVILYLILGVSVIYKRIHAYNVAFMPAIITLLICFFYLLTPDIDFIKDIGLISRILYKFSMITEYDRFINWQYLLNSPFTLTGNSYETFSDTWVIGYQYPHNFFVELYCFYGFVGTLLSAIVIIAFSNVVKSFFSGNIACILFTSIFIGSMLSGDLSENFSIASIAIYLIVAQKNLVSIKV